MSEKELSEGASPLYCRYNGMMMGFFFGSAGAAAKGASERYPVLRERLLEFAEEINVPLDLPEDHTTYKENHTEILSNYLSALNARALKISGFVLLGTAAIEYVIQRAFGGETEMLNKTVNNLMKEFGIPREALTKFTEEVEATKGGISLNSLHSSSLIFLKKILDPLPTEPQTAFVIMPFSEKYRSNFPSFYAPLLKQFGYQPIRAWGGIANEEYFEVLLALIDRSGAILVELSELNMNVMYELGYVHAQSKITFPLLEASAPDPPSNLKGLYIARYTRRGEAWQKKAIKKCALPFSVIQAAFARVREVDSKNNAKNKT
ncbi:MAG: hypothetical protein GTO45_25425 [Candidatus Aminicenantes bacterium]|nr:hypothetical protein [Candidatus Aminicenantes bacterium]NIM82089.1 hypothetical protein [Candidatus Aminicenantes bacterium]NIN21483.1 hypothetical protein [Candidatus Aminicenantes bacterium]NIN45295.1 hypothetical protein [Candidatus Aminicenantes bacterium]NIN88112.1 hypothetical protein [Candidatus Aminicenantes bacterium]